MPVPNPKVVLTLSIDARQAAAFLDARFDLVFPNSERVVGISGQSLPIFRVSGGCGLH
jgi:hypothetical protein